MNLDHTASELRFGAVGGQSAGVESKRPRAGMSSKTLRSLATIVLLLLTAAAPARAAVLYTFSSQAHSRPTSDFSFVVDDLLTTTTIVEASDLFDVITYIPDATLGFVVFTDPQTNPSISLVYPNMGTGLSIVSGQSHSLVWVRMHPVLE